ncbi:MAG: hypothetical protein DRZ79_00940 [Candidatus Cloacimonadota bacterium]|nr:MAG: hypothetical protein DRZ79_00940 [Candidatus Cloacimonadota bacterium]
MRIFLASYQALMLNRGGPTYKLIALRENLRKIGVEAEFFNMWDFDLKLEKTDLVHIFNTNIGTYSLAANLKLYGAKFVVNPIFFSNHSPEIIKLYRLMEAPFRKIFKRTFSDYDITKFACDNAEKVLPNTKAEGNLLIKGLGIEKNKVQVIYNGVEKRFLEADASLFQKKYGLKDFVLYVGHLGPVRKNGKNIIRALQKLDVPSVIIADILHNEEGQWCRNEIEKSKNISLIEWLRHDDPLFASAYAACHTFILPTRYETPGRAALEAALAGANVVITPFGGTTEYFRNFAEYVNPHSVESIGKGIEKALNKKKDEELKNHIKNNFLWENIAVQTAEMYQEILRFK